VILYLVPRLDRADVLVLGPRGISRHGGLLSSLSSSVPDLSVLRTKKKTGRAVVDDSDSDEQAQHVAAAHLLSLTRPRTMRAARTMEGEQDGEEAGENGNLRGFIVSGDDGSEGIESGR
jgi:hypothetical protein